MTQNFSVHVLQQHRHHQENNAPHAKKLGGLSVSKSFVANFSPPIPRIEREQQRETVRCCRRCRHYYTNACVSSILVSIYAISAN